MNPVRKFIKNSINRKTKKFKSITKFNNAKVAKFSNGIKTITKLWLLIAVLIILAPLGIIIPRYCRSGPAFGEEKLSSLWNPPMPDYGRGGTGYVFSAISGVIIIAVVLFIAGKFLNRDEK